VFLGDLIKPPATVSDLFAVRCYIVDTEFCEKPILFGGVMKMCSGFTFFQT